MTRIFIDTDIARDFRKSLDETTSRIWEQTAALQNAFQTSCGAWQGAQRQDFELLLQDFLQNMQKSIEGFEEDKQALDLRIAKAEEIASHRLPRF